MLEAYTRHLIGACLVLDEAITTTRRSRFIQNANKFDYLEGLVASATADPIEKPVTSLWFVRVSKRKLNCMLLVWFWMKQSQRQGEALSSFNILLNYTISTAL